MYGCILFHFLYLLTSVQALGRKAQTFNKLRLMQTSLKQWRVASRESLFYQIRERRLQSRALVVWKGEMDRVEKLNGTIFLRGVRQGLT